MRLYDFSDLVTPEAYQDKERIKRGTVLSFNKDGQLRRFRITRLNRTKRICKAVEVELVTEQQLNRPLEDILKGAHERQA